MLVFTTHGAGIYDSCWYDAGIYDYDMDTFVFVCTCYSVTTKESKKDIISATALVIYVMKGKEHHIVSLRKNIENLLQKHLVYPIEE